MNSTLPKIGLRDPRRTTNYFHFFSRISPSLARTGPDVIRNLSVTQITTSSVSLNWTEPQGHSSFYRVEWEDNTVPMNKTTSQTSMNITGLNAGAQYVFRVFVVAEDNQTAGAYVSKTRYTSKSTIAGMCVKKCKLFWECPVCCFLSIEASIEASIVFLNFSSFLVHLCNFFLVRNGNHCVVN